MKRMISLFFAGCMLIGIGIGITAIEISGWKISEEYEIFTDQPQKTYIKTIDFDTSKKTQINLDYYNSDFGAKKINVEKDADCVNELKIELRFRGASPHIYRSTSGNNAEIYYLWIDTYNANDLSVLYDMLKIMFEEKIYYINAGTSFIDEVTLYTAHPENITVTGVVSVLNDRVVDTNNN